jgi:toxin CcdB
MAQFDVFPNPGRQRERIPYLLEVQAEILADLATRLVVPLGVFDPGDRPPLSVIQPLVRVGERQYVMLSTELAHVPTRLLHDRVASLAGQKTEILKALDALFSGV